MFVENQKIANRINDTTGAVFMMLIGKEKNCSVFFEKPVMHPNRIESTSEIKNEYNVLAVVATRFCQNSCVCMSSVMLKKTNLGLGNMRGDAILSLCKTQSKSITLRGTTNE